MKMIKKGTMEINISWKLVHKVALMTYVVFALSVFLISITSGPVGMMVLHIASADFLVLAGTLPVLHCQRTPGCRIFRKPECIVGRLYACCTFLHVISFNRAYAWFFCSLKRHGEHFFFSERNPAYCT